MTLIMMIKLCLPYSSAPPGGAYFWHLRSIVFKNVESLKKRLINGNLFLRR